MLNWELCLLSHPKQILSVPLLHIYDLWFACVDVFCLHCNTTWIRSAVKLPVNAAKRSCTGCLLPTEGLGWLGFLCCAVVIPVFAWPNQAVCVIVGFFAFEITPWHTNTHTVACTVSTYTTYVGKHGMHVWIAPGWRGEIPLCSHTRTCIYCTCAGILVHGLWALTFSLPWWIFQTSPREEPRSLTLSPVIHSCNWGWEWRRRSTEKWNREDPGGGLEHLPPPLPPVKTLEIFYGDIYQFKSKDTVYTHFFLMWQQATLPHSPHPVSHPGDSDWLGDGGGWGWQRQPRVDPPSQRHAHTETQRHTHPPLIIGIRHSFKRMRRWWGRGIRARREAMLSNCRNQGQGAEIKAA